MPTGKFAYACIMLMNKTPVLYNTLSKKEKKIADYLIDNNYLRSTKTGRRNFLLERTGRPLRYVE